MASTAASSRAACGVEGCHGRAVSHARSRRALDAVAPHAGNPHPADWIVALPEPGRSRGSPRDQGGLEVDLYPWLVVVHIVAAFAFVMAHGVSVYAMYRVRKEHDRARLAVLVGLSGDTFGLAMISLLVVLVAGITGGIMQGYFSKAWIWLSIVILVVVGGAMTPLAAIPMNKVRLALGIAIRGVKEPPTPATDSELAALQASLRPQLAAAIGGIGLIVLVALMSLKPF